jgi:sugar phosphate isomerase/epimerase
MRIGISNVAWNREEDEKLLALLPELGVEALEVAPTRLWDDPFGAPLAAYRARAGLPIVALQSLLYGYPELRLFDESRPRTLEHLKRMCDVAAALGAAVLVFGSPENRRRGDLEPAEAFAQARLFFSALGAYAADAGVCVCIEPLPMTDFVCTVAEAAELAAAVGSPGFDVHLDSAVLQETGERIAEAPRHFHATEPGFGPTGSGGVDHARFAAELREVAYEGVVSIEMFAVEGSNRDRVIASVEYARRIYG